MPKKRIMRFEESWLNFNYAREIISKSWSEIKGRGVDFINQRILLCLKNLTSWNRQRLNGSIHGAIKRKDEEIQKLSISAEPMRDSLISKAESELEDLLEEEEKFWKIRSREDWLA